MFRSQPITSSASLFLAYLLLSGMASAAPSITLSKSSGPPTSRILVSGRGFEPNVGVDIYFDTKDEALVVTDDEGEFDDANIAAPRSADPGEHWVTALERNNDKGTQEPFLVRTNWPEFQFEEDHAGFNPYENVLNTKNVSRLNLKWSGLESLVVGGGMVVVDGVLYTGEYALNAATGAPLWRQRGVGRIFSVPAVANGVVYVGSDDDNLYALDARSGKILWRYTTGGAVQSSPSIAAGKVYFGSYDHNVYALDAATGAFIWRYSTGGAVESSPALANGVVYIGSDDNFLYALNAKTGTRLWSYQTGSNVISSPSVVSGVVYFGSLDSNIYALNAAGYLQWRYQTGQAVYSCPAVVEGVVFVSGWDGFLHALDAATGNVLWTYSTAPDAGSPVVANGVVYVGNSSVYAFLFAIDARTGELLWSYGGINFSAASDSPVVANGVLYGAGGAVAAFSLEELAAVAKPPDPRALRPDFSLKAPRPAAQLRH
jgi:outer membrane protein assembly factor BamB